MREEMIKEEEVKVDELMAKYDKGSRFRVLSGVQGKMITVLLFCFTMFQLYYAIRGGIDAMIARCIHLSFGLSAVFFLYPSNGKMSRKKLHWFDCLLGITIASCCMYIVVFYKDIVMRQGLINHVDMIVGGIAIILVLEAARRVIGLPMVIISLVFIVYALIGRSIPGSLGHRGVSVEGLVQHLFFTTEGILGLPIQVSSTFIFMFLLFGAYLEKTGMGEFFIQLANSISGDSPGGPAKVAVISSACMGTLSGSSVANVVGTGSFTIPMMKKLGYKPEFAGAVEATASTGGQLMPPIMGAAAFLLAEITGSPYSKVILAALVPAALYYLGVFIGVHYEAKKLGLKGIPKDEIPKLLFVLRQRGQLIIPIFVVIALLVSGWSPIYAALGAVVSTIICAAIKKETRLSFEDLLNGMVQGAKSALTVIAACACAGIIIGVVTKTGLGLKMGSILVGIAKGNLVLTLFFTMITSLVLGIGVPTTANYVITSTIAAPAILMIKDASGAQVVPILAAHLFVFYFGIIADVTPPVCLAAVAASGVAKSEPMKTGMQATRLAIGAFLIPYMFVLSPELILINPDISIIPKLITAVLGMICVAVGLTGYFKKNMNILERVFIVAAGIMALNTGYVSDGVAIVIIGVIYFLQSKGSKDLQNIKILKGGI
ncbi:TRAP transporter permease [Fusobacterium sp. IOR10]|uniref:TRAP transporter permease n=1 Tax=Fusobacterium sp. IOR10 TaxID=2665157 RepID=UPI0013D41C28|nr:TRAP transporter permease [Fusobacterium sp. IOR10]